MQILFTATSLVILIGCFLALTRAQRYADLAHDSVRTAEAIALKLKAESDRITVAERDTEALRRELRKLSGKFYAELAARELERNERDERAELQDELAFPYAQVVPVPGTLCENWKAAQSLGPMSEAASCECAYCVARRAERRRLRGELVPRTVQGQAELARLNAGKP